jgi:ketosteroid isomerase-like protein
MRKMISQGNGVPAMTPQHHANNDVKTRFVEALFANDWEAMAPFVHPDFELREPDALPYGGVYKGLDGFKKCWELIPQTGHKTEYLNTLRCYFTEDPDSIIVELDTRGTKHSGKKFASKVMEQFEFREGKILAITLFWFNI